MDILDHLLGKRHEIFDARANAYDVFLNGKFIDRVFDVREDPEEVKKSLIDHDGYDPGIKVRRHTYKDYVKGVDTKEGKSPEDKDSEQTKIKKLTEDEDSDYPPAEPEPEAGPEDESEPGEEEPDESIDKEYVGKTEDVHYYMVSDAGEDLESETPGDLKIVDQEGVVKYSAKDQNIEVEDPTDFLIAAIQDLEIDEITRSVFTKYILPKLEEEDQEEDQFEEELEEPLPTEPQEELGGEEGERVPESKQVTGKKKLTEDNEAPYAAIDQVIEDNEGSEYKLKVQIRGSKSKTRHMDVSQDVAKKIAFLLKGGTTREFNNEGKSPEDKDSEQTKIKKLTEVKVSDGENEFEVSLVDDGTMDTVIDINGREFRFDSEFASYWRDEETGELSDEGLEELALDALSTMEPEEYQELLSDKEQGEEEYYTRIDNEEAEMNKELDSMPNESKTNGKKKLPDALKKHMFKKKGEKKEEDRETKESRVIEAKDPKAKVRNRGDVVFDAKSSKVKDDKDHFPINSKAQARNALSRVAQYKSSPDWYKGSLKSLQTAVRRAVKAKYKDIEVSESVEETRKGESPVDEGGITYQDNRGTNLLRKILG